jgi:hypothetical protein
LKKILAAVSGTIFTLWMLSGCSPHRNPTMPVFPTETVVNSHTGSISGFVSVCPFKCSCSPEFFGNPVPYGTITGTPTIIIIPTATATPTPDMTPHASCPIASAPVKILSGAAVVANTTTDSNGFYKVSGLAPGTYSVQITIPGYSVYNLVSISVTAGADNTETDMNSTYLFHPGEIYIYFKSGVSAPDESALINSIGGTVVLNNQYIVTAGTPPVLGDEYLIQLPSGAMPLDTVSGLQANPLVNMSTVSSYGCACPI